MSKEPAEWPPPLPPIHSKGLRTKIYTPKKRHESSKFVLAGADNDRLEFLGDAVLGQIVAELLYTKYPAFTSGQMTKLRSKLVCNQQLARWAVGGYKLHAEMKPSEVVFRRSTDGTVSFPKVVADLMEAYIGGVYLESGFQVTRDWISKLVEPRLAKGIEEIESGKKKSELKRKRDDIDGSDPRHVLRMAIISDKNIVQVRLKFRVLTIEKGLFKVECRWGSNVCGIGKGRTRAQAERAAAHDATIKYTQYKDSEQPPAKRVRTGDTVVKEEKAEIEYITISSDDEEEEGDGGEVPEPEWIDLSSDDDDDWVKGNDSVLIIDDDEDDDNGNATDDDAKS